MMPRAALTAAITGLLLITACGGSDDDAAGDSTVVDSATTDAASRDTVAAETTAPVGTTRDPIAGPETTEATGGCPIGTWQIDGAGLEPFYAVAAPPDVTFTPSGRFVLDIGPETYSATAEGFSLDMAISGGVSMVADVSGTVAGSVIDSGTTIEFVETAFDLDATVTMDGAPMPNDIVLGAFRETFGTASRPYVCDGSTLTVTYDTANGPAVAVFTPA